MSFLSSLGNLLNPISQIRGLAQGTNALIHGDLRNAARGMSGVTTGINLSQRGRNAAPVPKTGPRGGGPMVLEQGDKGFGMPPPGMPPPGMQPSFQAMGVPGGMNKAAGMSFVQGGGPTGPPLPTSPAGPQGPDIGSEVMQARRQFLMNRQMGGPGE